VSRLSKISARVRSGTSSGARKAGVGVGIAVAVGDGVGEDDGAVSGAAVGPGAMALLAQATRARQTAMAGRRKARISLYILAAREVALVPRWRSC
jgi:hypothetical protein